MLSELYNFATVQVRFLKTKIIKRRPERKRDQEQG